MRKKGFTLIELIVVIAIIGVLAAILVPAMLGYVKKAKIQAGNVAAAEVAKAMNAVLAEESEDDSFTSITDGPYGFQSDVGVALEDVTDDSNKSLADYITAYSDDMASQKFAAYIKDGVVIAVAAKNGKYFGTFPAKLTNKNYDTLLPDPSYENALD
ncbi:MAG: prepilin-type N-terminal cleavage/methylation domain-containing protein, partial [Ruminococcus sp.]|nr:prepilin-type N-terminal cleavage/methylation domain-containing protein [Ruminococcus sp.]